MILKISRNRNAIEIQCVGLNLRHVNHRSDNAAAGRPYWGVEFVLYQAGSQTDDWTLLHGGIVQ